MDISYCCYGCGPDYFLAASPFLAVIAVVVAYRCAWLTRHSPKQSLARVWLPWLAIPAAFLWFIDYGETGYAFLRDGPLAIAATMLQVVFALAMFATVILSFIGPLKLLARTSPMMPVAHRFAAAAGSCELLWRGFDHVMRTL